VAATAVGLVALIFIGVAGFWRPFHFHITPPPDIQDKTTLAAALAFTLLGTGLNQELVFRGFLLNRLVKAFRGEWPPAIVTTAVVFGLLHFALGIPGVIDAALAGLLLGAIYLWAEKNLWVVVVGHSIANAIFLVYAYWTR
jgi:membrane protease YdiL (CAAX protease family)